MTTTIGFVGLGIMGKPMAKNLINAGYTLRVFDLNQEPVDEIVNSGATKCGSASEVASASDVVIVMVPDSADSEAATARPPETFLLAILRIKTPLSL